MEAQSVHSSQADVWYLKQIVFDSGESRCPVKIITQNFNGPCSFIAICNILILRGQIEILPHDRTTVSYEFLSQLVGEYLLTNCPDIDISAALSIMPSTTKGLDLNPQFTSITDFSPVSDAGELALFAQAGIQLVHGWVVDPDSSEAEVMSQIRDYDTAVTLIADADYITHGRLLGGHENDGDSERYAPEPCLSSGRGPVAGPSASSSSSSGAGGVLGRQSNPYSEEQRSKVEQAIVAQQFLDATKSQLTYHGLFQLASTLKPGSLVALFRNAHLSVVYKSSGGGPGPGPGSITPQPVPEHSADSDSGTPPNQDAASATSNPIPTTSPGVDAEADIRPKPETINQIPIRPEPAFQDTALYALVTDDVFLHEQSIVWERLEDIDGGSSWFVDSDFHRAVPIGGDVAGQTAEGALRRLEIEARAVVDPADHALAKQMQAEEDERARELYARRQQSLERRRVEEERRRKESVVKGSGKGKKQKNCVIM